MGNLQKRHHEDNKHTSQQLGQKSKENLEMENLFEDQADENDVLDNVAKILREAYTGLELERSKVVLEKNSLERRLGLLKQEAKGRDTNRNAARGDLAREKKNRQEDKRSQQKELEEMSEEMKQLDEDHKIRQKRLKKKRKLVEQLGENDKRQEKQAGNKDKRGKEAEMELKMLQPKLEALGTVNKSREESLWEPKFSKEALRVSEGKGQQHAEGQFTNSKRKKLEELINDQDSQILVKRASALSLITEGTSRRKLKIIDAVDEPSVVGTDWVQNTADAPKNAGKKKRRRRRRKPKYYFNRSSPTEVETETPLLQIQATRSALREEKVALGDATLSSASTEVIEEASSDPGEGQVEPLTDSSPAKHRRPGRRNSKRDHRFEAEKRERKNQEKIAAMARSALGEDPDEAHEKN